MLQYSPFLYNLLTSFDLYLNSFHNLEFIFQELPTFSDADEEIIDSELTELRDEALEQEIMLADRRAKREIRTLEEELSRLQVLVEMVPGGSYPDRTLDPQTLAVLRGRLVRYLMRSREVC